MSKAGRGNLSPTIRLPCLNTLSVRPRRDGGRNGERKNTREGRERRREEEGKKQTRTEKRLKEWMNGDCIKGQEIEKGGQKR